VESGISSRLQPWQSLFAILTYAISMYGIEDEKALILYGLILAALGFTMVSSYKHKETVKEIVAPWLVEQLLKTVSEYLAPSIPPPPSETPDEPPDENERQVKMEALRAQIQALELLRNGKGDSG
jgi:hypothetical protein